MLEGKWGIIPDMSGIRSLAELTGIDTAKRLTMTAEMISGKEAHDLGLVTALDADPVAGATAFAQQLADRSPDALAAAKRLFNDTWTSGPATYLRPRAVRAGVPAVLPQRDGGARGGLREGRAAVRAPQPLRARQPPGRAAQGQASPTAASLTSHNRCWASASRAWAAHSTTCG